MHFSILLLLLIKLSEQRVSFYEVIPEEEEILSCVNRIVKRHFDSEHQVTILTQGSKDYVKGMKGTVRLIWNISKPDKMTWFPEAKQAVVFLDGDFHRDPATLISLRTFHPRSRFLIVCTIGDNSLSRKNYLINLVQYLHQNRIWAVTIALKSISGLHLHLYGYTKTAYGNCESPELISFGNCSCDKSLSQLFPNTVNYNRCPLRLATFDWPPFARFVIENGKNISIGIESGIVNVIAERLNASSLFIDAAPSRIRSLIRNHDADIGYGQMAMHDTSEYSYTRSYSSVQGLILIPKVSSAISQALSNFMPLGYSVWIALILVVICVIILRSFLSVFKAIPLLNVLGLFLGLGVHSRPTGLSQRTYFISLVLFGYIITQAYLANLTVIFTKANDQDEIGSLSELEESTIPIGGGSLSRRFFENKYPRLFREYKVMDLRWFKQNLEDLRNGNGGLATYVEVSKYINYNHWKYTTILPETTTSYPVTMLVPNVSTILPICDWIIAAISESGVMEVWEHTLTQLKRRADSRREQEDDGNDFMDLNQFLPILRLLQIALSLSTIVFIIELLVAYWQRRKREFH